MNNIKNDFQKENKLNENEKLHSILLEANYDKLSKLNINKKIWQDYCFYSLGSLEIATLVGNIEAIQFLIEKDVKPQGTFCLKKINDYIHYFPNNFLKYTQNNKTLLGRHYKRNESNFGFEHKYIDFDFGNIFYIPIVFLASSSASYQKYQVDSLKSIELLSQHFPEHLIQTVKENKHSNLMHFNNSILIHKNKKKFRAQLNTILIKNGMDINQNNSLGHPPILYLRSHKKDNTEEVINLIKQGAKTDFFVKNKSSNITFENFLKNNPRSFKNSLHILSYIEKNKIEQNLKIDNIKNNKRKNIL